MASSVLTHRLRWGHLCDGTPLAYNVSMRRWIGALAVAVGGLMFLFPRASEAPSAQQYGEKSAVPPRAGQDPEPPGPAAESVRIEHRLVAVQALPAPPAARAVARAVNARTDARPAAPQRFGSRARRVLVGDGRYRPEPFPRPTTR
jgi:hypothetical protein